MAEVYDESSDEELSCPTTNVLLGYASKEATDDTFSQLGGSPTWPEQTAPSSAFARCKTCNKLMCLLLQLNGDLPDRLPGHERRLYIFGCKEPKCRRKAGSTRAIRGSKIHANAISSQGKIQKSSQSPQTSMGRLGDAIFATNSAATATSSDNPSSSNAAAKSQNPFSTQAETTKAATRSHSPKPASESGLAESFASKATISAGTPAKSVREPWPTSGLPKPHASYYLDADYESLEPIPSSASSSKLKTNIDTEAGGDGASEREIFESSMDKTFQHFADRLAQNPEQILRYEFAGVPLLYSKTDAVGSLLSPNPQIPNGKLQIVSTQGVRGIPNCINCGKRRVFELQLVPQAIAELEADDMTLDGMDWGTIVLGVCEADCAERGVQDGSWGWVEEWVGVQWEELRTGKKA